MKDLIKLSSVTEAIKARDMLAKNGIKAVVTRIPAQKSGDGCGYGLDIKNRRDEAMELIKEKYGRAFGGSL